MTVRIFFSAVFASVLLWGTGIVAQEVQPEDADESQEQAETNATETVSNEDEQEADDATAESASDDDASPPAKASTEVFIPTEEVSVDRSISMPVDI